MTKEEMRDARKHALHMTQTALGEHLGLCNQTIMRMETGKSPVPKWMPLALKTLLEVKDENVSV